MVLDVLDNIDSILRFLHCISHWKDTASKSPTKILALFPQRKLDVFSPLLNSLSSMTSSCSNVALCINSIAAAIYILSFFCSLTSYR